MHNFPPHILVLDDDEDVRETVANMLSDEGLSVDAAADGLSALDKIDAEDFDLIVTDVHLAGGLDGLDTVRCAKARHPALRSLFISGGSVPVMEDPQSDDFVWKPFNSRELLGCVWELLKRDPPRQDRVGSARIVERGMVAARVECLRRQHKSAVE